MKYENLSWTDALELRNNNTFSDVRLRFSGTDLGDHYAIIEDWSESKPLGHAHHYFIFWTCQDCSVPFSVSCHTTMLEAMLMLARRFNLDNCDGADTRVPEIEARHDELQNVLKHLVNY